MNHPGTLSATELRLNELKEQHRRDAKVNAQVEQLQRKNEELTSLYEIAIDGLVVLKDETIALKHELEVKDKQIAMLQANITNISKP